MDLPNKSEPPKDPISKNLKPVVDGVVQVPRPITKRFLGHIFADSPKNLLGRVSTDVLLPRAKAGMEEALNSFIHGMFWGQGSSPASRLVQGTVLRGGVTTYNGISSQPSALAQAREANETRNRPTGGYEDLVCPSQETAERLLTNLYEVFNQYRVVCVADLYELANIPTQPSDNVYGWMSLDGARITKVRNGYLLELPRPTII